MERQKLSIDLDSLFPGSTITIGTEIIVIRPLSIEQLALLTKKVKGLGSLLTTEGITWENYNTYENLFKLAVIILDNVPDVLEEASNVDIDDLKRLPIEIIVQILDKIIEENMKSKEVLEKNFKSLTAKFLPETEPNKKDPTPAPKKKIKR
jgi:hypothetical protein